MTRPLYRDCNYVYASVQARSYTPLPSSVPHVAGLPGLAFGVLPHSALSADTDLIDTLDAVANVLGQRGALAYVEDCNVVPRLVVRWQAAGHTPVTFELVWGGPSH